MKFGDYVGKWAKGAETSSDRQRLFSQEHPLRTLPPLSKEATMSSVPLPSTSPSTQLSVTGERLVWSFCQLVLCGLQIRAGQRRVAEGGPAARHPGVVT